MNTRPEPVKHGEALRDGGWYPGETIATALKPLISAEADEVKLIEPPAPQITVLTVTTLVLKKY